MVGTPWLPFYAAAGYPVEKVSPELEARGATLEQVASFREVLWDNRPERYWHRFPRVGDPFAPQRLGAAGPSYPDAVVYRVLWP